MSQVIFTVQDELKKAAMAKAKAMGVPLKVVLQYCMDAWVKGQIAFGITATPTTQTAAIPLFDSIDEEMAYYDQLATERIKKSRKKSDYAAHIWKDITTNKSFWDKHVTLGTQKSIAGE